MAPLSHDDACRLSRLFLDQADLGGTQDQRINAWLKVLIEMAWQRESQPTEPPVPRYQHVVFNHALGIERLLSEHNGQLIRIVPYTQYESVMVLEHSDE